MNKVQLHLGCGEKYIPGFIHIDFAKHPHIDYSSDIRHLSMFDDCSVDLIYCCHALEYFNRQEVVTVLKEWGRVLRVGGLIRLSVPDFESIVKVYLTYKDLDHQGILGPLYGRWQNSASNESLYHKTAYDFRSLEKVLQSAGFSNVVRYNVDDTVHKDYDDYSQAYIPHMNRQGICISLNVEAIKIKL